MYRITHVSFVAALFASSLLAQEVDVYLIGGQSNASGHADTSAVPASILTNSQVMLYHSNVLVSTALPYTWTTLRPAGAQSGMFGPEISMGNMLQARANGRQIALIKHSRGGSSLYADWKPGANAADTANFGPEFARFVNTVDGGLAALQAMGKTPVLRGMVWQQGEKDARYTTPLADAQAYGDNLRHFIARVREQWNIPDLLFLYGTVLQGVNDSTYPYESWIRAGQEAVDSCSPQASATRGAWLIDADLLHVNPSDPLHLDAPGQLGLGELFADMLIPPTPPGVTAFGSACPTSVASELSIGLAPGSCPRLGRCLQVEIGQIPASHSGLVLALGASSTSWAGQALPLDLGFIGATGCQLAVSLDSPFSPTPVGGIATWRSRIPDILTELVGAHVYLQAFVIDLSAPNGSAGSSEALDIVFSD